MASPFIKDYKTALLVNNLGCDLPCFGIIYPDNEVQETYPPLTETMISRNPECIKLHMYEQVFDWFRMRHNIHVNPEFCIGKTCDKTYYIYRIYYRKDKEWIPVTITSKDPRQSALIYAINLITDKS